MDLKEILRLHGLYLAGDPAGVRANLIGADLREANLIGANLREADLYGANLAWTNLIGANLREANLTGANLIGANLREADLYGANLAWTNLIGANLREANLTGANLIGANLTGTGVHLFQTDPYHGYTVPGVDGGSRVLQFGCVRLTLDEWDSQHDQLAEKHEPANAANFAARTRALVALCRTLD